MPQLQGRVGAQAEARGTHGVITMRTKLVNADSNRDIEAFSTIVDHILAMWTYWEHLFDFPRVTDEIANLYERSTPKLLSYVRWSLLMSAALEIAKLGDPEVQMGRENLTLRLIYGHIEVAATGSEAKALRTAMNYALGIIQSNPFRQFRHRVLVHFDRLTAVGDEVNDVDIELLGRAVAALANFRLRAEAVVEGKPIIIATGENFIVGDEVRGPLREEADRFLQLLSAGLTAHPQAL